MKFIIYFVAATAAVFGILAVWFYYLFVLWFNLNGLSDLLLLLTLRLLTILGLLRQEMWLRPWQFSANWIFRSWRWDFHNDIGWLTYNVGFETFLWISSVCNGANEPVRINNRVAAFDHISIAHFFALLIVCELIIFNIETKLIRWIALQRNWNKQTIRN